jgi:hypothetical protein
MATHPASGSSGKIQVTPARRIHILDGDATGGGHGPGRRVSGKSEFPGTLTDDEIIDGVTGIANDPANYPGGVIPGAGNRVKIRGNIKGTNTTVIVDPVRKEVVTAYPNGIASNP